MTSPRHPRLLRSRAILLGSAVALLAAMVCAPFLYGAGSNPLAPKSQPDASASTRLRWREGDRQTYAVAVDSVVTLGEAGQATQAIHGSLQPRVLSVGRQCVEVGFQLAPLTLRVMGVRDPAREQPLGTAFVARFEPAGRPLGFRFPRGLPDETRAQLEEVVRTFQVVAPDDPEARQWTVDEEHLSGSYRADYSVADGGTIEKRKVHYRAGAPISDGARVVGAADTRVVSATASIRLARDASWVSEYQLRDELSFGTGGQGLARVVTTATLELSGDAVDGMLAHAATARGLLDRSAAAGPAEPSAQQSPGPVEADAETAADIERIRQCIAAFAAADGKDVDRLRQLRNELIRFPELARAITEFLADGSPSDDAAAGLVHVLELCGTAPAQDELVALFDDADRSRMNRLRGLIGLGGVGAPTDGAIEALWRRALDRGDPLSDDLANTALLSLGRLGDATRDTDPSRYAELKAGLLDALRGSRSDEACSMTLKALGNTRDPALVPELTAHLGSPSPRVRASAAGALGTVDGEATVEALSSRLRAEPDGRVRAALASSLAGLTTTRDDAFATVQAKILDETDGDARHAMARYLADHLDTHPGGRATLAALLRTETQTRTVRYVAGRLHRAR